MKDTKMKDFQFYLNKDGNVVVCFGPYQPGGDNGKSTITLKSNWKERKGAEMAPFRVI